MRIKLFHSHSISCTVCQGGCTLRGLNRLGNHLFIIIILELQSWKKPNGWIMEAILQPEVKNTELSVPKKLMQFPSLPNLYTCLLGVRGCNSSRNSLYLPGLGNCPINNAQSRQHPLSAYGPLYHFHIIFLDNHNPSSHGPQHKVFAPPDSFPLKTKSKMLQDAVYMDCTEISPADLIACILQAGYIFLGAVVSIKKKKKVRVLQSDTKTCLVCSGQPDLYSI